MPEDSSRAIQAGVLVNDILPKLTAARNLVENTLADLLAGSQSAETRERLARLQSELELELLVIKLNIDSLLTRHAGKIEGMTRGREPEGALLTLDEAESIAIDRAMVLYQRTRELQSGEQ